MLLMETKNGDDFVKDKLQSFHYPNYFAVSPDGASGGLSLLWKDTVQLEILEANPNFIDTKVLFKGAQSHINFTYGALQVENRAEVWAKISAIGSSRDTPWLLTGDFNEILDNEEKEGGPLRWEGSFTTFRSFVADNGLWDLKHSGNKLSWRGSRYLHHIKACLDRSMANCAWSEAYPKGRCCYLRVEGSDHRPLITYFNSTAPKRRGMFRFNRTLTEDE